MLSPSPNSDKPAGSDADAKVRALALQVLDEAIDDEKAMLRLINNRFVLSSEQLKSNAAASALQIRFLSLPQGFKFLRELDWYVLGLVLRSFVPQQNYNVNVGYPWRWRNGLQPRMLLMSKLWRRS